MNIACTSQNYETSIFGPVSMMETPNQFIALITTHLRVSMITTGVWTEGLEVTISSLLNQYYSCKGVKLS